MLRALVLVVLPLGLLISIRIANFIYKPPLISPAIEVFFLLYFLGFTSASVSATYYIKDIYNEKLGNVPFRYFMAYFFGLFQAHITINRTDEKSKEQKMA